MQRTLISQTPSLIGQKLTLKGWVNTIRDHGKLVFIELSDRSGLVQVVGEKELGKLHPQDVLEITGTVNKRPEEMINKKMPTGEIEIQVEEFKTLSSSKELPFPIDGEGREINEEIRLQYRYLDLKRERLAKNIRLRSKLNHEFRKYLLEKDFVEIETPMLTKSTKEGARDFIVPSRFQPGKFYALPQSPQQYKQLLMTANFERYFQLARCIRDEDLRADRGFEFTQLDLEMSFVTRDEVMQTIEEMVKKAVLACGAKLKDETFPVFQYGEALEKFGQDKFDLRNEEEKKQNILAFAWVVNFPFFKKVDKEDVAEVRDGKSGWTFTHNPFSMPNEENLADHLAGNNIENIKTQQYDLVCNGFEVGGGSIRAHKPEILKQTFKIMGYSDEEIEESIGHMLKAFSFGTPPHGGIALGMDRLVMLLTNEITLKESIAFPMSSTGRTAIMDAPSQVSSDQLKELGIAVSDINSQAGTILN